MTIRLRAAEVGDAAGAAEVVRRSIQELCTDDHGDDPERLGPWLENKTPDQFVAWIEDPHMCCVVAAGENGAICGFGMLGDNGDLHLLYLTPEATGGGTGRELLTVLEEQARVWKLAGIQLQSTRAAVDFYRRHGFEDGGGPKQPLDQLRCHPMHKVFAD